MKKFTLVELIVVIAIMALLAVIITPNVSNFKSNSITAMVNSNIRVFQTAVDIFNIENDKYPTIIQPTIGKPQLIDLDQLYPKYIKTKPKETTVGEQYYWVDYTGRVWGSTVDAPSNFYASTDNIEWNVNDAVTGFNVYEVKTKTTSSLKEIFSFIQHIKINNNVNRVQLNLEDNDNNVYLISSIDRYGLETAPVGLDYQGMPFPSFKPILLKEGEFYYDLSSEEVMYWDDFRTIEHKPEGTEIFYSFAVGDNLNELGEFTDDFYSLEPAKSIRVKIKMVAHEGKYPSLYDIRVFYHFANEMVLTSRKLSQTPNMVTHEVKLEPTQYIEDIIITDSYSSSDSNPRYYSPGAVTIEYSTNGSDFQKARSISSIPAGSYVHITREGENITFKDPIVKGTYTPPVVYNTNIRTGGNNSHNDPELNDDSWSTFQTLAFFTSTTDGQLAHWIRAEIQDTQPENTRILYRYATSNDGRFGTPVDDFGKLSDSRMLKVIAYLQIKKSHFDQEEKPSIQSIKIHSSKGVHDLSLVKPHGVITLTKSNNQGRDVISTETNIEWGYDYFDPQGKEIIEVQWGGDKRERYETPGTYTVTLRLRNELNYWSDTITFKFTVVQEKPVAVIGPSNPVFSSKLPITWNSSSSYDPDGDGIKQVQWSGDYRADGKYQAGEYTIKLRVQDNEGHWSDWTEKTFRVVNSIFVDAPVNTIDGNQNTYSSYGSPSTDGYGYVRWLGDLTNRVVSVVANKSAVGAEIYFVNDSNQRINFIDYNTGNIVDRVAVTTDKKTYNVIVPKNATKLAFMGDRGSIFIYELIDHDDKTLPNDVSNVTYESTKNSITLHWDNPNDSDFVKVAVYRGNTFLGYVTDGTITDSPLMPATTYNYTLKAIDQTGNHSVGVEIAASTVTPTIIWSGLNANAYDDDLNTYYSYAKYNTSVTIYATWTGDLAGKEISVTASMSGSGSFGFMNSSNQKLSFVNKATGQTVSSIGLGNKNTYTVIVPEGATKLYFTLYGTLQIYDIRDYEP